MTSEPQSSSLPGRRRVLRGLIGVGGLAASGLLPGLGHLALAAPLTPAVALGPAATAEAVQVTLYHAVLTGATFHINSASTGQLRLLLDAARQHLDTLRTLDVRPPPGAHHLPGAVLSDASVFVQTAQQLAALVTAASIAAAQDHAALGQPRLAGVAAQLAASAAQHQAVLAHLAGLAGDHVAWPAATFGRTADAWAALAPYTQGEPGWLGPLPQPSVDQLQLALAGRRCAPSQSVASLARTALAGPRRLRFT